LRNLELIGDQVWPLQAREVPTADPPTADHHQPYLKTRSTGSTGTESGDIHGRSIPVSDPPNFRT
jgi:hypothetical protein